MENAAQIIYGILVGCAFLAIAYGLFLIGTSRKAKTKGQLGEIKARGTGTVGGSIDDLPPAPDGGFPIVYTTYTKGGISFRVRYDKQKPATGPYRLMKVVNGHDTRFIDGYYTIEEAVRAAEELFATL